MTGKEWIVLAAGWIFVLAAFCIDWRAAGLMFCGAFANNMLGDLRNAR